MYASVQSSQTDWTPDRTALPPALRMKTFPSLSFSTVLNGVNMAYTSGEFRLNQIQATFIDANAKGYAMLRKADGVCQQVLKDLCDSCLLTDQRR